MAKKELLLFLFGVRKCMTCGFVIRHSIIYCPNCGQKLAIVKMTEEDYSRQSQEWCEAHNFSWKNTNYDEISGQPTKKP